MFLTRRFLGIFIGFSFLVGCATPRVAIQSDVWKQNKDIIGVAIATHPDTGIAQYGGWMAFFNPMTNPKCRLKVMLEFFKTTDLSKFDDIADNFVKRLKDKKMKAKRIEDYVDLNDYKTIAGAYDLEPLARKEKIDVLIVLSIDSFGTWDYYVFNSPVGSPRIFIQPRGYMVNFRENNSKVFSKDSIVDKKWLFTREYLKDTIKVKGDWNQSPSYQNMHIALNLLMVDTKKC